MTKIIPITTGMGHVYLVKQAGNAFLVDAGHKRNVRKILKSLKAHGIGKNDLRFIFITHAHYDHAGGAAALRKATGAPLIIHQREAAFLQEGYMPLPKGTSPVFKALIAVGKCFGKTFAGFPPVIPDVIFTKTLELSGRFGIKGVIVHTPGHTQGSSTLLVDGNALAGDTVFNIWGGRVYPVFADDEMLLKRTWSQLLKREIQWFYPAHGKRFSMAVFKQKAAAIGID